MKQGKKRRVLLIRRLHSKSSACELLKPGFDWLSRQQTTVEAADNRIQRPPPRKSFVFNFFFFSSVTCYGGRGDFNLQNTLL